MLGKTDPQENFFDSYIKENFLPEEHELLAIAQKVNFSFIREKTRDLYTEEVGRPSYPPDVIFKILFLPVLLHLIRCGGHQAAEVQYSVSLLCGTEG